MFIRQSKNLKLSDMPSLKIYPPSQLPDRDVTETQFNIWQEELEVYLLQEKDYAVFLKDGAYETWESLESKEDTEVDEEEIAEQYGYVSINDEEVINNSNQPNSIIEYPRNENVKCGYIKPVPSQILTVFQDIQNKSPIHIELDSGATVSYCLESEARKRGFKIFPNGQLLISLD